MGVTYSMDQKYKKAIGEYSKAIGLRDDMASTPIWVPHGCAQEVRHCHEALRPRIANRSRDIDTQLAHRIAAQISSPRDRGHDNYVVAETVRQAGRH
jgi:hypothetical protein